MVVNFYLEDLCFPSRVEEFDHCDIYPESARCRFECYYKGDTLPSFVFTVNEKNGMKGVSFDG